MMYTSECCFHPFHAGGLRATRYMDIVTALSTRMRLKNFQPPSHTPGMIHRAASPRRCRTGGTLYNNNQWSMVDDGRSFFGGGVRAGGVYACRERERRLGRVCRRGDVAAAAGPVDVWAEEREIKGLRCAHAEKGQRYLRTSWPKGSLAFSLPGTTLKVCAPK